MESPALSLAVTWPLTDPAFSWIDAASALAVSRLVLEVTTTVSVVVPPLPSLT